MEMTEPATSCPKQRFIFPAKAAFHYFIIKKVLSKPLTILNKQQQTI